MAKKAMKVRRIAMYSPNTKEYGFTTRAIVNGTETFESVAEEAARNTTISRHELVAALGLAAEQFARSLAEGRAVDLGPLGKLTPGVNSHWTRTADEQELSKLKRTVRYEPSDEMRAAISSVRLEWDDNL